MSILNDLKISALRKKTLDEQFKELKKLSYPKNKDLILSIINDDSFDYYLRRDAVRILKYPDARDELIEIAKYSDVASAALVSLDDVNEREFFEELSLCANNDAVRFESVFHLHYPQSRKVLEKLALDESNIVAVSRLPYPECRDTLINILHSCKAGAKTEVIDIFPYPDERELLEEAATGISQEDEVRLKAIEKLQYPQSKDALLKIIRENENDSAVKTAAARKLPIVNDKCPLCGGKMSHTYEEVPFLADHFDANDITKTVYSFSCESCGLQILN